MDELKPIPFDLAKHTGELKKLIAENPDYPIVVIAGKEANGWGYTWMFCSDISFSIGEILDCECPYETDFVCTDREDFEERFEEWLWDKMCYEDNAGDGVEPNEEEFQKRLKEELAKYEPLWKKVIAIYATN